MTLGLWALRATTAPPRNFKWEKTCWIICVETKNLDEIQQSLLTCGAYGTWTRDPLRDRQVFWPTELTHQLISYFNSSCPRALPSDTAKIQQLFQYSKSNWKFISNEPNKYSHYKRRVYDSNIWGLLHPNGFQDRRIKPLCQLSMFLSLRWGLNPRPTG